MAASPTCQCNRGATGLPKFAWKVAVKMVYVCARAVIVVVVISRIFSQFIRQFDINL